MSFLIWRLMNISSLIRLVIIIIIIIIIIIAL
jgi:hypothetical protein